MFFRDSYSIYVTCIFLACVLDLLVIVVIIFCFFFFQAEDGIRDLVRSRGLGDVYKRQLPLFMRPFSLIAERIGASESDVLGRIGRWLEEGLSLIHI